MAKEGEFPLLQRTVSLRSSWFLSELCWIHSNDISVVFIPLGKFFFLLGPHCEEGQKAGEETALSPELAVLQL